MPQRHTAALRQFEGGQARTPGAIAYQAPAPGQDKRFGKTTAGECSHTWRKQYFQHTDQDTTQAMILMRCVLRHTVS